VTADNFAQQAPATILLEACGSSHHWARQLTQLGHVVRLLPAHDVHRYVRRNKTDRTDAKALLEAARNEEIHPVPIKTIEHQAITSLHCLRSTWLATRTARLNTVRGLLREFGIFIPVGAQHVVPRVRELLAEPRAVPDLHAIRTTRDRGNDHEQRAGHVSGAAGRRQARTQRAGRGRRTS
jgi:transposase